MFKFVKGAKITALGVAAAAAAMILCVDVYAAGSVSINASNTEPNVGEQITVSVLAEGMTDESQPPQLSIEYDGNRLNLDACSTEYGGGGGLITITEASSDMTFTTLSGGTANIKVSAIIDGDGADVPVSEVNVNVAGEDTAALAGGTESASASTGVAEGTITSEDGRTISTVFADEYMPILFHKTTATYQGQTVEAAQFDMGNMLLLFTLDATGAGGSFCIYDQATGGLSDFRMIQGIENRFIIILPNNDAISAPEGYRKAQLQWNGQTLVAYLNENETVGADGVSTAEFFLVYAMSSEGKEGWYQYDQTEGTYQRFVAVVADDSKDDGLFSSMTGDAEKTVKDNAGTMMIILIVMGVLLVGLIATVIVLAVKLHNYGEYDYIDEDEYYAEHANNRRASGATGRLPGVTGRLPGTTGRITAGEIASRHMGDDSEDEEEETQAKAAAAEDGSRPKPKQPGPQQPVSENTDTDLVFEDINAALNNTQQRADDDEEDDEDDEYYYSRDAKRAQKERAKQLKREQKEAMRDEKYRLKEEKRLEKSRKRGYAEPEPMDWSAFGDGMREQPVDKRRPMGNDEEALPQYMQQNQGGNAQASQRTEEGNNMAGNGAKVQKMSSDDYKTQQMEKPDEAMLKQYAQKAQKAQQARPQQPQMMQKPQQTQQARPQQPQMMQKPQAAQQARPQQPQMMQKPQQRPMAQAQMPNMMQAQPQMQMPNMAQAPVAEPKYSEDLDEDFSFEFLSI